jgi:hypothetical protein
VVTLEDCVTSQAHLPTLIQIQLDFVSQEKTILKIRYFTGKMLGGDKTPRESDSHNDQPIQSNSPIS